MTKAPTIAIGRFTQGLATIVLSVAALYFGREILMPLAIAVLLAFLLSPLVRSLERFRIPRVAAVLFSVIAVFAALTLVGLAFAWQVEDFASHLSEYRTNLRSKLEQIRFSGRTLEKVQATFNDLNAGKAKLTEESQPVRVVPDGSLQIDRVQSLASGLASPVASGALVVMLVIFMLINREDLRNRLVRLTGKKLALTTRTLDEISARISRYLVLNAFVNGGFGITVGIGLALIGVRYALMWGLLSALLRFIPYLGPIVAASLPVLMALMQFPGHDWLHLVLTAGLFVVLELVTNGIIEPLVYGRGTGVSTVALLVAAMFWTWVWGPIGLALAVPLTVIAAVIGEHVAPFEPLAILLGDKPRLAPHVIYYQRLLAGDTSEASTVLREHVRSTSLSAAYDEIVIPALALAERDLDRGELAPDDRERLWQSTRMFLDEFAYPPRSTEENAELLGSQPIVRAHIVGCPAHDAADETVLFMLRQTLVVSDGARFDLLAVEMLASEMLAAVEAAAPDVVCISALGPRGARQARYLCKRLHHRFPQLRLMVARWGFRGDRQRLAARLRAQGADHVVTTMAEASDVLVRVQRANGAPRPQSTAVY